MNNDDQFEPGEFRVVEMGLIKTMDDREIKGSIIECPAGPPTGMTWADVWTGTVFTLARPKVRKEDAE